MAFSNAVPRIVFGGINDLSRGTVVRDSVTFAQHTPLLRLFCETGPSETTYVGTQTGSFAALYGSNTLNRRGPFYNMQSLLAERLLASANGFFVKRLKPTNAPNAARIIVALEIVDDQVNAAQIALSGFNYSSIIDNLTDTSGVTAQLVSGKRVRLVLITDNASNVGTQQVGPGVLTANVDGAQSTRYPLFELPASFFGAMGNNLGIRIWAPTTASNESFDQTTADQFKTRLYRVQFVQKPTTSNTPSVIQTALGEDTVDISFDQGVYSETLDKDYYAGDVLIQSYEDDGVESGLTQLYSPFSEIYVYGDNIATVQGLLYANEVAVNPSISASVSQASQMDFLTFRGEDGDPYQSILVETTLGGGIVFGNDATVYAQGGGDGTTDYAMYEDLVNIENTSFGQLGDEYEDRISYPFSHIYDTGLSMDSKYTMMSVLGKRSDLTCVFTTFCETDTKPLTVSEEISRAQAIQTRLEAMPESTLYNTPVCRADIVMQSGKLMSSKYTRQVPLLIDYAVKWANFAGAGTGIMRDGKDIDQYPNNQVTEVKSLNVRYFNSRSQSAGWASGAIYSLPDEPRSSYYPCIRTIYSDETSVLLSPITRNIATDIERLIWHVHKKFSGNAKITKEQLIERCDEEIVKLVENRYAGRVVIIPSTYITAADASNHYSFHCKVSLYANNPTTVMNFELDTLQMTQLQLLAA